MSRRLEAERIIREIRYQLWPYPTTWGACACGDSTSRGGRRCVSCLQEDLGAIVDPTIALNWVSFQDAALKLERDILDEAERKTALDKLSQQAQDLGLYDDA